MIDAVVALAPTPGLTASACVALNLSRASVYRQRRHLARPQAMPRPRPKPRRALDAAECQIVLNLLHAPRFADQAPAEIYACLLDEGFYHCSIRTMYRILAASQEAPTPGDAVNAGYSYLMVRCLGCDTHRARVVRRPKSTLIHELE